MIHFSVRGHPMTQGSKTGYAARRKVGGNTVYTGKVMLVEGRRPESRQQFQTWRSLVSDATQREMAAGRWPDPGERWPIVGPLLVRMTFTMKRPTLHYKVSRGHRTGVVKDVYRDARPCGKPDLCKLARAVEDAITGAGLWLDDAQVVEYERLAKVYPDSDPESLPVEGVVVSVRRMEA